MSGALCLSPFFARRREDPIMRPRPPSDGHQSRGHGRHVRRVRQSDAPGRCRWGGRPSVSNEGGAQDGGAGVAPRHVFPRPDRPRGKKFAPPPEAHAAASSAPCSTASANARNEPRALSGSDARARRPGRGRVGGDDVFVGSCSNTVPAVPRDAISRRGRRRVQDGRQGARGGARARRRSRHGQQSRRLERRRVRVRGERAFEFQTGIFVRGAERQDGQTLELDLYDHDEGVFDADDFLGRVSLPLEHVPTASEGGERRTVDAASS